MTKSVSSSEVDWIRLLRWLLWLSAMPALLVGLVMGHGLPARWFGIVLFAYSFLNIVLLWWSGKLQRKKSLEEMPDPDADADPGEGGAR